LAALVGWSSPRASTRDAQSGHRIDSTSSPPASSAAPSAYGGVAVVGRCRGRRHDHGVMNNGMSILGIASTISR